MCQCDIFIIYYYHHDYIQFIEKKSILLQQVDGIVGVIFFFHFICTVCLFLMEPKLNAPGTGIKI